MSEKPDVTEVLDFAGENEIRVSKGVNEGDEIRVSESDVNLGGNGCDDAVGVKGFEGESGKNGKDEVFIEGVELVNGETVSKEGGGSGDVVMEEVVDKSGGKGEDSVFTESSSQMSKKSGGSGDVVMEEVDDKSGGKGKYVVFTEDLVNGEMVVEKGVEFGDVVMKEVDDKSGEKGKDLVFTKGVELVNGGVVSEKGRESGDYDSRVLGDGNRREVGCGYEIGDMVWGKVKSHPWWPGHIYDEELASPSVKRSKREGHILVAFFGDSSYGWFELEELVPFEPNFDEKSRQTHSKTFTRAVEEAIDEVERRSWLGLACRCKSQYNFRPSNVEGFYDVDVGNNESAGVFSLSQIKRSRGGFKPSEMIVFMKKLALTPMGDVNRSMNLVKHKAAALAYRKAQFEEFDETYAQAFGAHPIRPEPKTAADLQRKPSRAPLSGPLVFAEGLGKEKASSKTTKAKDRVEKDKYLFKRRDEAHKVKTQKARKGQALSKPSQSDRSSLATLPGSEIITSVENQVSQTTGLGDISPSPSDQPTPVTKSVGDNGTKSHAEGSESGQKMSKAKKRPAEKLFSEDTVSEKKKKKKEADVELSSDRNQIPAISGVGASVVKAVGKMLSEDAINSVKKKKKRTKEAGVELSSDHNQISAISGVGASVAKAVGKKSQVASAAGLDLKTDNQRDDGDSKSLRVTSEAEGYLKEQQGEDDAALTSMPLHSMETKLIDGSKNSEAELRKYIDELRAFAIDPLDGGVRSDLLVMHKTFLKFRSLVYQKSLASLVPAEADTSEFHMPRSPSSAAGFSDNYPIDHVKETLHVRPLKPPSRPEDLTIGSRKRGPSDRQEEIAAKRKKKIITLKSMATERKLPQKASDAQQRGETKEAVRKLAKPVLSASNKRTEPAPKLPDPTMLIMKFPPGSSLPSSNEVKAKFTRFGTLDSSKTRIFWQSYQVRLVYLHKHQAESALKFASSGKFWNTDVRCSLRDLSADTPDSVHPKVEDAAVSSLKSRDSGLEQRQTPKLASLPLPPPSQLKSCLKRSSIDESSSGGNGSGRGSRVKFVLGWDDESGNTESSMIGNRNLNNNASFADEAVSCSSTTHAMDFNSKNIQNIVSSSSQLPNVPLLPVQFPKVSNNMLFNEGPSRNIPDFNIQPLSPPMKSSTSDVDIAQQMIGLLTKCNDVVNGLKGALGYVPYHPL